MGVYDEDFRNFQVESANSLNQEREADLSAAFHESMKHSGMSQTTYVAVDDYDAANMMDSDLPEGVLSPRYLKPGKHVIGSHEAATGSSLLGSLQLAPEGDPTLWQEARDWLDVTLGDMGQLTLEGLSQTVGILTDVRANTLNLLSDIEHDFRNRMTQYGVPLQPREPEYVDSPIPRSRSYARNIARDFAPFLTQYSAARAALVRSVGKPGTLYAQSGLPATAAPNLGTVGAKAGISAGAGAIADFASDPRTDSLIDVASSIFSQEIQILEALNPARMYEDNPMLGRLMLSGEGLAVGGVLGGLVEGAVRIPNAIRRLTAYADDLEQIGVDRMRQSTHQLNQGIDPEGMRGMIEWMTAKILKGAGSVTGDMRESLLPTGATSEQMEEAFVEASRVVEKAASKAEGSFTPRPVAESVGNEVVRSLDDIESRFPQEQFRRSLVNKPAGDRTAAKKKLDAGERLEEADINALSPGMRRRYVDAQVERMRPNSPFTHDDLTAVPPVPQEALRRWDPPRGGSPAVQRLAKNNRAYKRILEWARKGNTPEGLGWYNTAELRQLFIDELGEKAGADRFNRFIDLVAATSAGAKVPTNISIATYYDVIAELGHEIAKPPKGSGYGHKAQNLHFRSAEQIIGGGPGLDVIENPKRYSFAENLKGNWRPATVDKHNVRAWGMASRDPDWLATKLEDPKGTPKPAWWTARYGEWDPQTFSPQKFAKEHPRFNWEKYPPTWFKGAPAKSEYKMLEELNERLAKDLGVTPAQAQAALWLGAGDITGLGSPPAAFVQVFEEVLLRRAAERGQTPRQALKEFLRGTRPLAIGGAVVGASQVQEDATL